MSTTRRRGVLAGALLSAAITGTLLTAEPAEAHATVQLYGSEPAAGGYGHMFMRIPHGCEGGKPTDTVTVKIPTGFTSVKPERKDGWKTRIGRNEKGRVTSITWYGGNLRDDHFEDFGLSVKYPEKPGTYHLPTTQRCGRASVTWDQVAKPGSDPHALEKPAPSVTVTGSDTGHGTKPAGTGKALGDGAAKSAGSGVRKESALPASGKGSLAALVFNGRITLTADLPNTLRGRIAQIFLEREGTQSAMGSVRLDHAGNLLQGYPTTQSGPNGISVSDGDSITVEVAGSEVARTTVALKK